MIAKLDLSDKDLQNSEYQFFKLMTMGKFLDDEGKRKIEVSKKTPQVLDTNDTIFNILVTGDSFSGYKKSFQYEHNNDVRKAKFYEVEH